MVGRGAADQCTALPAVIVLVGNKADLEKERQVSSEEAQAYADR